ncbi:hypothetical protein BSL78_07657 [Apostichopus japonicus]|uniref:Uncharacterized protein n=1 Tax=Stichopus japonicus TaxID=307972 RepID=A0A2G8L577_STIJA|nr:hypothetical protein BSL78_07657 [Apostichopus japonicus]
MALTTHQCADEEDPVEVIQETTSRRKITLLVKQFLIVLEASNCSRVSARWYVEQLDNVQTWAYAKKRSESQDLPSALHQHVNFVLDIMDGTEAPDDIQPGTKFILKCFRDLCSLLWMLHLRDKLSEALRRGKIARYMLQICKTEDMRRVKEQLKSKQEDILLWAKLFLPFANVFGQSEDIKDIILTTVLELDLCKEHVANLAYSFYDEEAFPPGLTEKFQRLKKRLSQKKVYQERKPKKQTDESMKSISLLMYFKLQCKMRRVALRSISKAFGHVEETIFASTQGLSVQYSYDPGTTETPIVGSRELEYSPQFLNFLETFFLVTFGSLPNEKQQNFSIPLPLINEFYHDICNKELGLKLRKVPKRNECDVEISTEDLLKWLQNAQSVPQPSGTQSHDTQVDEGLFQKNFETFSSDDVIEMYKWQKEDDVIVYSKEEVEVMDGAFLDLAVNKGFSKSNILWGSVYTRLQKLLNWLKVWPEQEHNSLLIDEAEELSGITLKLHPPSLLVVLGLWLLRHHLQETYKGRVWKDVGQVTTHEISRRILPEVKSQVAVSSDDLKKSKETHDLTRKQQIRENLLSVSPVENESFPGGKKPQMKRDVKTATSKSGRRVLPSEPDKGSSVILREHPKHPVELVEDNDDRDTRKNRLKTPDTVKGKGVNSEPVPKTKLGGIMRADVHVYMDDSSSDTDVSEEEMFEQDEDVSLALPELSSHLVRKSSFGRYDKTRIPSVAEDIMGIHTSSSSFSAGLLQGDSNTDDITEKEPTFLRNSSIQQQNEQSEIFQITQPGLRPTEETKQVAILSHQESQTVPIGIRTLVERQDTVVKTHQESQTSPIGIKTLDAHHQESYSGLDKRHEGTTELNRADKRTGEHTDGIQSAVTEETQVTPNMIAGQKDYSRSKGFLNKYVEGKQSLSVDALGLPFPILTLPKEEEVHLIDKQYRELPMQESRFKPIGTFPLLTLDRDVSPVIQAKRNKTQRVCLPLVQQTSVDEVKQAKIHTTEVHQPLSLRGRAIHMICPYSNWKDRNHPSL